MEYKEISCKIPYREYYLPNRKCKKPRAHIVTEDYVLRIRIADEFPAACIIHGESADIRIRRAFDGFWRKPEHGYKFEAVVKGLEESPRGIIAGSKEDIEQGYDPDESIPSSVDESRKARLRSVNEIENNFVWYDGEFWRRVDEPYFETDFNPYSHIISAHIHLVWSGRTEWECAARINPNAYALRDKGIMQAKIDESVESSGKKKEAFIDDVDVLMPEAFRFGIDAEDEIIHHGGDHLPSEARDFLQMLQCWQSKTNTFTDYVRKHVGEYAVRVLVARDEPIYRLSEEVMIEAINAMLTELVDAKQNALPF